MPMPNCGPFSTEIQELQAYHSFIPTMAGTTPASSALVAFHNLVTSSVTNAGYLQGGVRQYYCLKDVLLATQSTFSTDLPTLTPGPTAELPGLTAQHRLLACAL
mmetsp:Transcript_44387/g.102541  ORF Transcript_44387/g.102541 Transcript_44387/m.102541 type:complete len:104 (+) Transcript_44387:827-1138(+)